VVSQETSVAAVCGRVEERAPAPVHDELRKREHSEKRKCGITRDEGVAAVCGRPGEWMCTCTGP